MKSAFFALCLATVALATPASSQGIYFGVGPGHRSGVGVGVDVAPYPVRPYRERYIDDPYAEVRCRDVTTRTRKLNGDVIVTTRRVCD